MIADIKITIDDWIYYNPNVGTEMLLVIGLLGKGKTSMAHLLMSHCVANGEKLIMPGDRFCEWRHYLEYPSIFKKIRVIIPENIDIGYVGKNLLKIKDNFNIVNYEELDVMKYLDDDTDLLVIYDAHLPINERAWLWVDIYEQILNRRIYLWNAIGILFNEAGILFSEETAGDHWHAVSKFSESIVDSRKGLVRLVFVSQLPREIKSTIRKKALWRVYRKGIAAPEEHPSVKKNTPFLAIDEYILAIGGLFNPNNKVEKFPEMKEKWRMIPPSRRLINQSGGAGRRPDGNKKDDKKIDLLLVCIQCNHNWKPRTPNSPQKCPACGSRQWNNPKKRKKVRKSG